MKSTLSPTNDLIQLYPTPNYTSVSPKISSTFQRGGFGLGLGFNSPKNDPQKVITLSTRISTDIGRNPEKPVITLERKSSRPAQDASARTSGPASASKGENFTSTGSSSQRANSSRGASADKRKTGQISATNNSAKFVQPFGLSNSVNFNDSLKKDIGYSSKTKNLQISTNIETEKVSLGGRSHSTKNQNTNDVLLHGTIRKNISPQYTIEGPQKAITSSTPTGRNAPQIAFSNKVHTEPGEGSAGVKGREAMSRPVGSQTFYGSFGMNRDSSKDKLLDKGKEVQKGAITSNRKIGFSSNGQLKYTNMSQGVIKSNNFFSNTASGWTSAASNREKGSPSHPTKADHKVMSTEEDLTKSNGFDKRPATRTQDLRASLPISTEGGKSTDRKAASEAKNIENKNQEKEETPTHKVSLDSFVTKVSKGNPLGAMQKSMPPAETKSSRPASKGGLSVDDKPSQGVMKNSSSVVQTPKTTKNVEPKSLSVTISRQQQQQLSPQEQSSKSTKQSKPSTPTLKKEPSDALIATPKQEKSKPFIYFMTSLEKYHREYDETNYFCQIYREHFVQSFQAMVFCKYLKPIEQKVLSLKKQTLPKRESHKDKKTLIFDLDETLIHCNESTEVPSDVVLPIRFPHGEIIEAGINVRPYAIEILKELSPYFEIIVFTASHSCYANVVLDYLDPRGEYIHHRLFREHCMPTEEGVYVKDLRVLGNRNMHEMVIVDNAAYSFGYQIDNGIPVVPFYDNKNDQELKHLIPYLKFLSNAKDVREINKITFKLGMYSTFSSPEHVLDNVIFQN